MNRLTSLIRISLAFLFVGATALLWMVAAILLLPFRPLRIKLANYYGKLVGSTVTRIFLGNSVEIAHRERLNQSMPAIYITNHSSTLDIFLSMWVCPVGGCGIAKKEIAKIPLFGQLYFLSGHLLIDRGSRDKAIEALKNTAELVRRHGLGIWIWPEGTRSHDGRLRRFKKGYVHMAIATGLPVVPVVMHNIHQRWPKKTAIVHPGPIKIDVLEAIDTSKWSTDTLDQHIDETMAVFVEALSPEQRPLEEQPPAS